MKKIIITIDGYSSCGKSTLAKQLANQLNYIFIDSGAMYRAITLFFLENNINWNVQSEVLLGLSGIKITFHYNHVSGKSEIYLNDKNVEEQIREMRINNKVSEVSTIREVREFAVAQQQGMGKNKGIVMDGRDIGTTVFPKAELKIFLIANIEVRVERRYRELREKNPGIPRDEIRKNLELRDYIDSNREFSPLRKADDAIVLDNSYLTCEEQLNKALEWAKEKI